MFTPNADAQFQSRPVIGDQKTAVILVELKDIPHFRDQEYFKDLIFSRIGSYFREVSHNVTWISGDVHGWYPINRTLQEFVDARKGNLFRFLRAFATDALNIAESEADLSQYSRFVIIHSARRAVSGNTSYTIYGANITTKQGVNIDRLQIGSSDDSFIVTVHEFGHNLGALMDLYDADLFRERKYASIYVGPWDVMSNDNRYRTPTFMAWYRMRMGWLAEEKVRDVNPGETLMINLAAINVPSSGTQAIRVRTDQLAYYLVEVRLKRGPDATLPSEGMLVTYINETAPFGKGPARLADANPKTKTLDDAAFNANGNSTFIDTWNNLAFVITRVNGNSYMVSATTAQRGMLAQQALAGIKALNQSIGESSASDQKKLSSMKNAIALFEAGNFEGSVQATNDSDESLQLATIAAAILAPLALVVGIGTAYFAYRRRKLKVN